MIILYIAIILLTFYVMGQVVDGYFVPALDKIAEKFKLPSDAAGATLMAMGSSAPELFIAIIAILKAGDHGAIGVGTIVGSALFNILVIIGVAAMIRKTVVTWQPVVRDVLFYALSIVVLLVAFRDGVVNIGEAVLFVLLYVLYVVAVLKWKDILPYPELDIKDEIEIKKNKSNLLYILVKPFDKILAKLFFKENHYIANFFLAIIVIAGMSWVLVEGAVEIAVILNIPEVIIALTVLAIGTSIPDLLSSVVAARRGSGGMAISNAIGSNIFDILFGLGFPWFILLLFTKGTISVSTENLLSSVILLFATVIVIFFLLFSRNWKIGKKSGVILVSLYILYLIWTIFTVGS